MREFEQKESVCRKCSRRSLLLHFGVSLQRNCLNPMHHSTALSACTGVAQYPHTHDPSAAAALEHVGRHALNIRKPSCSHVFPPLLLLIFTAFSTVIYCLFPIAAITLSASVRLIEATRRALIHTLTSYLKEHSYRC